jgi:uncharacterized membrane protein YedE/YeeE
MKKLQFVEFAVALVAGIVFAVGLALSQMVNPAKVLNFLDVAGQWDPTLALVMGGAVLVTIPAYRLVLRRARPIFDEQFYVPSRTDIDARLVGGAAVFGVGWGLAGICPGPALTALATAATPILAFVLAMTVGMLVYSYVFDRPAS